MLSRVAESVYWMARYLERAEDTARLVSVNSHLLLDLPKSTRLGWSTLVTITGSDAVFDQLYEQRDEKSILNFFCLDKRYPGSILSSVAAARENLRTTRDVMPQPLWEEVNQLYLTISKQVESGITPRSRDNFLNRIIRSCETVTGIIDGTLSYTQARTFLKLGRYLERADMTTRILDVRSENLLPRTPDELTPFENLQWMSVLKSLSGFQMYRQQVRLRVRGPDVLRFLLQDKQFPRSVACSLSQLCVGLGQLPGNQRALAAAEQCLTHITEADISLLAAQPDQLHFYIDQLQVDFLELHAAITATWFTLLHEQEAVAALAQSQG